MEYRLTVFLAYLRQFFCDILRVKLVWWGDLLSFWNASACSFASASTTPELMVEVEAAQVDWTWVKRKESERRWYMWCHIRAKWWIDYTIWMLSRFGVNCVVAMTLFFLMDTLVLAGASGHTIFFKWALGRSNCYWLHVQSSMPRMGKDSVSHFLREPLSWKNW